MIYPRGNEEMGRGIGVIRDALCHAFREYSVSHMVGCKDKVPVVRHDTSRKEWKLEEC